MATGWILTMPGIFWFSTCNYFIKQLYNAIRVYIWRLERIIFLQISLCHRHYHFYLGICLSYLNAMVWLGGAKSRKYIFWQETLPALSFIHAHWRSCFPYYSGPYFLVLIMLQKGFGAYYPFKKPHFGLKYVQRLWHFLTLICGFTSLYFYCSINKVFSYLYI